MNRSEHKPKKSFLRIVLAVLLVLLLLIGLLAVSAYAYYRSKINMLQPDETHSSEDMVLDPSEEQELNDQSQELNSSMNEIVSGLETVPPVTSDVEVAEDDHVLNILLIGTDDVGPGFSTNARGDSCMLFSINTAGDHPVISLVSFERGMGVPILEGPYEGQWDWLTHTFRYGGADLMLKEIRHCFKIDVDYYVRVNFLSFIAGIDALGGVDVEFDWAEANYFIENHDFPAVVGTNHLNGRMALKYARLRSIDSDWQRIQRQREVVQSAILRLRTMNLADANALIDELMTLVRTNLTEEVITELLFLLPRLPNATLQQKTIPEAGTYGGMTGMGGRSLFSVDFQVNSEILHEFLYGPESE